MECHGIPWDTEDCHSLYGSMLFPWHFSGIIWHPGGMLWNAMEFHGIQKIAIVSMVSMLFPWHFSGILCHPGEKMLWNAMEFHGIQKIE